MLSFMLEVFNEMSFPKKHWFKFLIKNLSSNLEIPLCENLTAANAAFNTYNDVMYGFLAKPSKFGCPKSCSQTIYDIEVKYFHENAFIQGRIL